MIDIIVPVFNAYEYARRCVDAVLSYTNASEAMVWVINDASPDPRIKAWLDWLDETAGERVRILHNAKNLGFVQTANRGMSQSGNDVVLLNSDAMVTPGWLDKLLACAYSRDDAATATPFSNNAEICSYPVFCRNTRIDGLPLGALCQALDAAFDSTYPEIPTAVGFCMFIKRKALDELGLFDAARFGRGYGEENDFCWRARNAGWVHLLCTNVWVTHLGGQSFNDMSAALQQNHLQRLLEVHPDYSERIAEFIARDPVAPYRQRIVQALSQRGLDELGQPQRPGILLVTHALGGGVARHVVDLAQLLERNARVEILEARGPHHVSLRDTLGNSRLIPTAPDRLSAVLKSRGYERIHIHHLHGYPLDCASCLFELQIPVDVTIHDFSFACPQYNLSLASGKYCGEQGEPQCQECLTERPHPWGLSIADWRQRQHSWLLRADRVIVPSVYMAQRLQQYFPDITALRWEHPPRQDWLAPREPSIRVALIGGISVGKGLQALLDCASYAAVRGLPVDFTVVGYTAWAIPRWPDLPIHVTGSYDDADLPRLLQAGKFDCLWLASAIPESYSYTLDAAMSAGAPVIASADAGAVPQRLAASGCQRALVPGSPNPAHFIATLFELVGKQIRASDGHALSPASIARMEARDAYGKRLLEPALVKSKRGRSVAALPLVEGPDATSVAQDRERILPLTVLIELGVDCGNATAMAALRARAQEADAERRALDDLAAREGRPWFEYLDHLHAERATLYAERGNLHQRANVVTHLEAQSQNIPWLVRRLGVQVGLAVWHGLQSASRIAGPKIARIRQLTGILLRGLRRWPVIWSTLRHEGPVALWRRVSQKLSPPAAASTSSSAFTPKELPHIGPLVLHTCPPTRTPKVSIVIPVHGQHRHTFQCLQSLAAHTRLHDVEVIVMDDASPEPAAGALHPVTGVSWLHNPVNVGFVRSCNKAAQLARGQFLVLLNNDTEVTAGWLDALLSVFEQRPDAGLTGAQLIYPNGQLQEAGGIVWRDASAWNWGRMQDAQHPDHQTLRPADYCSGACLAIRRSLWDQLGGFDEAYAPAYYEDTDLAFRVRQHGLQVYYQPACQIIHHEGITSGTNEAQGIKRHQALNRTTFLTRWQSVLQHWQPNGVDALRAANRWARKRVLIVEACMVTPDQDSGSVRMAALMRLMLQMGVHVSFVADNLEHREPYTRQLRQAGVEVWHAPYIHSVTQLLQERGPLFDVVMLCRHYIASPLVPAVRKHAPQAQLWFDTVDLHYLREQRQAELEGSAALQRTAAQTQRQELDVIQASDLTLVVSPVERAVLSEQAPEAAVQVLSNIHDPIAETPGFEARNGLLFVGGFQHPPNVDAVMWFANEVWPLIRQAAPGMVVRIVGSKMPERLRELNGNGIEVLGFVEDLNPLLASSRISISPLRYGAGVKGKINQAMAHGLPVVATTVAVEGMGLTAGEQVLVADTPAAFAEAVLRLHETPTLWNSLSTNGKANVDAIFSSRVARQTLEALLFGSVQVVDVEDCEVDEVGASGVTSRYAGRTRSPAILPDLPRHRTPT